MDSTLFSCLYGSHLFGTATAQSDRDEKYIVLPALDQLLLGFPPKTRVEKTNKAENTRNTKDDVDREYIAVQTFARDFLEGQSYALELAFAVEGAHAEQKATPEFNVFCKELRTQFLTSDVRAMMGYAVNQANLYSFKGERLNALRGMQSALAAAARAQPSAESVGELADANVFAALAQSFPKYFRRDEYDIGSERRRECFILLEKTLPFTTTIAHAQKMLDTLEKKYGERANEASATNVDWKAFMHALRIVDEGIELLSTHALTLPRSPGAVARYLDVRNARVSISELREELAHKIEMLKTLGAESALPRADGPLRTEFYNWLATWMRKFYRL